MSGAGKSYWAKRMQILGYRSIICDNLIAEQLGPLISSSEKSTLGLAAWMGKPNQPGYKEAQASAAQPLEYVRLLYAAGIGFLVFNEIPTIWTWTGAVLIIGSSLYTIKRNTMKVDSK